MWTGDAMLQPKATRFEVHGGLRGGWEVTAQPLRAIGGQALDQFPDVVSMGSASCVDEFEKSNLVSGLSRDPQSCK